MRLGILLALLGLSIACASSNEKTGTTGQGGTAGSSSGGSGGSAGVDSGFNVGGTAGAPADECSLDTDCIASPYEQPIASEADCYCLTCPNTPLSKSEDAKRAADWSTHCSTWASTQPCPDVDCAQPPMVFCQKPPNGPNRCSFPDPI